VQLKVRNFLKIFHFFLQGSFLIDILPPKEMIFFGSWKFLLFGVAKPDSGLAGEEWSSSQVFACGIIARVIASRQ
jgi:hypothetical protein